MEFGPDLYNGYALFKLGGRSFSIHAEVSTEQVQRRTVDVFDAGPQEVEVAHRGWYGRFALEDADEASDFAESLAQAVIGGHDVELQLPTGEQARIEIEGDGFTGLDRWPLG